MYYFELQFCTHFYRLYSWGWGVYGQLGLGSAYDALSPTRVTAVNTLQVAKITAGYSHSVLLTMQVSY